MMKTERLDDKHLEKELSPALKSSMVGKVRRANRRLRSAQEPGMPAQTKIGVRE